MGDTIHPILYGLCASVARRTRQGAEQLESANNRIRRLEDRLEANRAELEDLRGRLGVVEVPDGFVRNDGHVALEVFTDSGQVVVPQWIRRMGSGEVQMVAGRDGGEPVYVAELFIEPAYTNEPTQAMPAWFLHLLQANDASFHTLAQAARTLPDWGAYAEVMRYRRDDTERRSLEADIEELNTRLRACQERLEGTRHRMEAGGLPHQLRNLEGRGDFERPFRRAQYARRGRGVPRVRIRTDPGVSL
jgi:hypothetical protein